MGNRIERNYCCEKNSYLADLRLFAMIHNLLDEPPLGRFFVVTGSHAVQLLTGEELYHNDLDANMFVRSGMALDQVERLISLVNQDSSTSFTLLKKTDDRLEYDVVSLENDRPRRVELQIISIDRWTRRELKDYYDLVVGINSSGREVIVPITAVSKSGFIFRVKTLPYLIATWVIRLSGLALNPKRAIRDSDIEHIRLLLEQGYSYDEVVAAMRCHPQMPSNYSEEEIFQRAMEVVNSDGERTENKRRLTSN